MSRVGAVWWLPRVHSSANRRSSSPIRTHPPQIVNVVATIFHFINRSGTFEVPPPFLRVVTRESENRSKGGRRGVARALDWGVGWGKGPA